MVTKACHAGAAAASTMPMCKRPMHALSDERRYLDTFLGRMLSSLSMQDAIIAGSNEQCFPVQMRLNETVRFVDS